MSRKTHISISFHKDEHTFYQSILNFLEKTQSSNTLELHLAKFGIWNKIYKINYHTSPILATWGLYYVVGNIEAACQYKFNGWLL